MTAALFPRLKTARYSTSSNMFTMIFLPTSMHRQALITRSNTQWSHILRRMVARFEIAKLKG